MIWYVTMLLCFAETPTTIPILSFPNSAPEVILFGEQQPRTKASPKNKKSKKSSTLGKRTLMYATIGRGVGFHNPSQLKLSLNDDNIAFLVDEEKREYVTPGKVAVNASSLYQENTLEGLQLGFGYLYKKNWTWRLMFSFWDINDRFVITNVTPELPELTLKNLQVSHSSLFIGKAVRKKYLIGYIGPSLSLNRYEMDVGNYRYNEPIDTSIDILGKSWASTNKPTPDLSKRMLGVNLEVGGMITPVKFDPKSSVGVEWNSVFGLNFRDAYSQHTISLVLTMR